MSHGKNGDATIRDGKMAGGWVLEGKPRHQMEPSHRQVGVRSWSHLEVSGGLALTLGTMITREPEKRRDTWMWSWSPPTLEKEAARNSGKE